MLKNVYVIFSKVPVNIASKFMKAVSGLNPQTEAHQESICAI